MNIKFILKWTIIACILILLLGIIIVLTIYVTQEAQYVQYDAESKDTQVLFIGNSYTYANELPNVFSKLAQEGGYEVGVAMLTQGGWTLKKHNQSTITREILQEQIWDYVVLQEQSVIPSKPRDRERHMYPAVRDLIKEVDDIGAESILFMTWGRRDGLSEAEYGDYYSMQVGLEEGYLEIAEELDVMVAPVGIAWQNAIKKDVDDFWTEDGSHPNEKGTYLAACVFYAVIFQESPEGLVYMAGLEKETGQFIQTTAADTVFEDIERWNMKR